jgi:protein-disulfide isomerase
VPILDQVIERYPTQVKVVFKNFPLRNHNMAVKAAKAALAAETQGKFWEFHHQLFKYYNRLSDQIIEKIVNGLDLNKTEFDKQMRSSVIMTKIQKDLRDGKKAGVKSVPTVFINGTRLRNRTFPGFEAAINKELEKVGKTGSVKAQ